MKDEAALLKAARRLDQHALTAIFDAHASEIYKYVLRTCHDPAESDNIVGAVFAKLVEEFASGNGPVTNVRSYLFRIAYHLVVDDARPQYGFVTSAMALDTSPQPGHTSTNGKQDERHLIEAFSSVLENELSEIQRHVIILRFMEGFSLRETAAIVEKKVNHVKVIQNRGMAKLLRSLPSLLKTTARNHPP